MKSSFITALLAATLVSMTVALLPRQHAPDFKNVNAVVGRRFTKVSLKDYAGKYLILLFYPFDFTYVCPTELIAFSEALPRFKELKTEILGISTDSHFTHLAWLKTSRKAGGLESLNYPLLSDLSKDISRDYQVLVEDP